jgi:hypothetical protein
MELARFSIALALSVAHTELGIASAARASSTESLEATASEAGNGTLLGTECTSTQKREFWDRFQIGKKYGKPCSEEDEWGNHIEYQNSASPKTIALYLYPGEDHNNAFGLCGEAKFDGVVCKRLHGQSEHYSVQFYRVSSVEEATEVIRSLPSDIKIKHLVLAGHGDPTSFQWGDGSEGSSDLSVEDETSDEFLDAVYPHLLIGSAGGSTVMLDACLNGKVIEDKNMVQHVAHRLAGATVYGSKISWGNDEFFLKDSRNFDANIVSENTGKNRIVRMQFGTGPLRDWSYYQGQFCDDKASQAERGVTEIQQCREACERSDTCKAFVWYPSGNKFAHRKCYLSDLCEEATDSSKGAMIFERPDA